jgi:phosphate transport system permease protein
MAQLAATPQAGRLRARAGLGERLDIPRRTVFLAAASMIGVVALLLVFISWQGIQLFVNDGVAPNEILSSTWQPDPTSGDPVVYGLLPFIYATIGVTVLALVVSTPLSVGLGLFLSEVAPGWARAIVQPALEIFVGIPSVVWGVLGATVLVPILHDIFAKPIHLGTPLTGDLLTIPASLTGKSWLAGALVLSIMVLPTITSVSYDAFRAVPQELRTGSLALGTTRWQTIRHILLPAAASGVLTGVVLGMTRAAGEALAVQMVIGNTPWMPHAITQPLTTLTSAITLDMGEATGAWRDGLWTMSLCLLVLSVGSVVAVRVINRRGTAR